MILLGILLALATIAPTAAGAAPGAGDQPAWAQASGHRGARHGIGVKNELELARMFEHFVSTKPQGLGLGLAISRSIVEAHGGQIWATRNDDAGLTLHVELPVPSGAEPEAASPEGAIAP